MAGQYSDRIEVPGVWLRSQVFAHMPRAPCQIEEKELESLAVPTAQAEGICGLGWGSQRSAARFWAAFTLEALCMKTVTCVLHRFPICSTIPQFVSPRVPKGSKHPRLGVFPDCVGE
jgi:hypothetical protein